MKPGHALLLSGLALLLAAGPVAGPIEGLALAAAPAASAPAAGSAPEVSASAQERYAAATRHAERGELDQAIAMFGELAGEYPGNVLIHYSLGVAHLLHGDLDPAQSDFERVLELDPGYANALFNLATVHERKNQMDAAVVQLQRVIEVAPDSSAAQRARVRLDIIEGGLLAGQGSLADAAAAYERALREEPANRDALTALASVQHRLGDAPAERDAYARIVAAYPDDQPSRLRLAELYYEAALHREAFDQLETLGDQQPTGAIAARAQDLARRVRATPEGKLATEERLQKRIRELEERIAADPNDTAVRKSLGLLHLRHGDYAAAADAFESVRDIDPGDWRARLALATIYDNLGRFADAAVEFEAVLAMDGVDEEQREHASTQLKTVLAKQAYSEGHLDEATRRFEDILAGSPDDDLAHFYLGMIYSQEEQTLRAVDAYQEVIRIVPNHVGARLQLAASYERLNREEDAIDEYNKILQAHPPSDIATRVQQAMENVRQRQRGLSGSLGYVMAWDDNTNLSDTRPVEDFRSDVSLNLAWQYKTANRLRWRLLFAPTYSTYHRGQYDYLNTTTTLSLGMTRGRYNLLGGYTHRTTEGLITSSRIGRMDTLFAEAATRARLPSLLRPWSGERVSSNVSANASYSDFESTSSPFFSAWTAAAGVSLSQPINTVSALRTGYQYVMNNNKELVGNDYAYTSHSLSLGIDYRRPWGVLNASYGLTVLDYTNPDSFSQFTRRRQNLRHNFALGASWRYRPNVALFSTVSWTKNESNLPVGFILGSEDIIEGLQSSSLSDYDRLMVTGGVTVGF